MPAQLIQIAVAGAFVVTIVNRLSAPADLYLAGCLELDELVSHWYGFEEAYEAFDALTLPTDGSVEE